MAPMTLRPRAITAHLVKGIPPLLLSSSSSSSPLPSPILRSRVDPIIASGVTVREIGIPFLEDLTARSPSPSSKVELKGPNGGDLPQVCCRSMVRLSYSSSDSVPCRAGHVAGNLVFAIPYYGQIHELTP